MEAAEQKKLYVVRTENMKFTMAEILEYTSFFRRSSGFLSRAMQTNVWHSGHYPLTRRLVKYVDLLEIASVQTSEYGGVVVYE